METRAYLRYSYKEKEIIALASVYSRYGHVHISPPIDIHRELPITTRLACVKNVRARVCAREVLEL